MATARPAAWIVSGADTSGGAGFAADIRTCNDLGVHAAGAVTAVTPQRPDHIIANAPLGAVELAAQMAGLADTAPPRAIKVGQLPNKSAVDAVAAGISGRDCWRILDPVLAASSGQPLTDVPPEQLVGLFADSQTLITPNIVEAEALTGRVIDSDAAQQFAGDWMLRKGFGAALIKGGHRAGDDVRDYYCDAAGEFWLSQPRGDDARGTGCVLSSAIAAFVAQGKAIRDAVVLANAYLGRGLRQAVAVDGRWRVTAQCGWPDRLRDFPSIVDDHVNGGVGPFPDCGETPLGLYPIVDDVVWVERLLPLGVSTLQLRIKSPAPNLSSDIARAVDLGRQFGARVFINDHWELAIEHGAYGVHLGQQDLAGADLRAIRAAGLRLGISTHGEFEWSRALSVQPSYIALGTVFPTQTKPAVVIGLANLRAWVPMLREHVALTAIGGITPSNAAQVLASGVRSIAVASAITADPDWAGATRRLLSIVSNAQSG